MPFPMKIQPIDFNTAEEATPCRLETAKPVVKSRFKRLFERQFPSVLRNSTAEKVVTASVDELPFGKEYTAEFEPSSVCLRKMVQNFMEENGEKQQSGTARCSRNRCNCFNRNSTDSSEDETDTFNFGDANLNSSTEASEILNSLVSCASVRERNLLADTSRIVEKNKMCKRKDDICRKVVTDGLSALGYDASICKSRWEKSSFCPAGEYEYIDVIIDGERLLIDIDFRSEFEIARSTKTYKSILQILPFIFVGRADRLQKIIAIVSDAVKQSLKKKGMHIPPWRKAEYVKAKWLSPHDRASPIIEFESKTKATDKTHPLFEFNPKKKNSVEDTELGEDSIFTLSESSASEEEEEEEEEGKDKKEEKQQPKPSEIKPKSLQIGITMVTGLASVIEDEA